jgi:ABC-type multidrug transport system ATPase subunit
MSRGSFTVELDDGDDEKEFYSSGDSVDGCDDDDIVAMEKAEYERNEYADNHPGAENSKGQWAAVSGPRNPQPRISRRIVNARELSVQYPNSNKMSLNELVFKMTRGERVALMGMNGGGKSTLFKTLALAENVPVDGSLSIGGLDIVEYQWEIARTCVAGYVPQEGGLFEYLSVRESFELFYGIKGLIAGYKKDGNATDAEGEDKGVGKGSRLSSRADDGPWSDVIGSTEKHIIPKKYMHYLVHALSGGNKKKLSVAIANIASPSFLAMDECTSGVDPVAADRIVAYLRELKDHQGLLFASHRIDECISVCDRVLILAEGSAYFDGSVHAFDELASLFYQVDLVLPSSPVPISGSISGIDSEKYVRTSSASKSYQNMSTSLPASGAVLARPLSSLVSRISSVMLPLIWPSPGNGASSNNNRPSASSRRGSRLYTGGRGSPDGANAAEDGLEDGGGDNLSLHTRELLSLLASHCALFTDATAATVGEGNSKQHRNRKQRQRHSFSCFERVVEYSPTLLRLTFEKRLVPLSKLWITLEQLQRSGAIEKVSFRTMDMEEALATIIASSKGL